MWAKHKNKIIIISSCFVAAVAVTILVLLLVLNVTTTLNKLYEPKSEILSEAGYSAEILSFDKDIDEFKSQQQVHFDNADVRAVIKIESNALLGVEFKSVRKAKRFYSALDYVDKTIHRNIVMFSSAQYMSGLLVGKINNIDNNYILTHKVSELNVLIRAGEVVVSGIDIIGYRAFSQSKATEVEIPPSVTRISRQAFFVCRDLTKISFADNSLLTKIDSEAFFGCVNLADIVLPSGVNKVGELAFWGNENLQSVKFSGDLNELGEGAFYGCTKLTNVEFTRDSNYFVEDGILYCKDYTLVKLLEEKTQVVVKDVIKAIGYGAFEKKIKVQKIMPETQSGIIKIGDKAFENCIRLSSCELFGKVEYVGDNAFLNTKIDALTLNEGLSEIGESAFRQTSIREVILPASLKKLGNYAFNDCPSLRKVIVSGKNSFDVGDEVFDGIYRVFVDNDEVKESFIKYKNFTYYMTDIVGDFAIEVEGDNVRIVQYLGSDKNIIIPTFLGGKKVSSVGKNAFSKLHFIQSISYELGSNLVEFKDSAVEGCQNLTSVRLPHGFKTLGSSSLRSNPKLENVDLPTTLTTVNAFALDNTLWLNNQSGEVIIGDGILYKFKSDQQIVTLSNKVKTIGDRAFISNTNIHQITLPDSVRVIDNYAFAGCNNLNKIILNDGLLSINMSVFGGCDSLDTITIPHSVYFIGYGSFYKTHLSKIYMQAPVPCSIGGDVFAFPQNPQFKIYVNGNSMCQSTSGVCTHADGKTKCYKHASRWTAYRQQMEAA